MPKHLIMKKKLITFICNARWIALQVLAGGGIIFFLDGCGCESYCGLFYSVLRIERTKESLSYNCSEKCLTNDFSYSSLPKKKTTSDTALANGSLASTKSSPSDDSNVIVGNPVPQKNAPGQIESPQSGISNKNAIYFPGNILPQLCLQAPQHHLLIAAGAMQQTTPSTRQASASSLELEMLFLLTGIGVLLPLFVLSKPMELKNWIILSPGVVVQVNMRLSSIIIMSVEILWPSTTSILTSVLRQVLNWITWSAQLGSREEEEKNRILNRNPQVSVST